MAVHAADGTLLEVRNRISYPFISCLLFDFFITLIVNDDISV